YNFPADRVTDHRIGLTVHNLPGLLAGDLDRVIAPLRGADQAGRPAAGWGAPATASSSRCGKRIRRPAWQRLAAMSPAESPTRPATAGSALVSVVERLRGAGSPEAGPA